MIRSRACVVALAVAFVASSVAAGDKPHAYVGIAKCGRCHDKELYGKQVEVWRKGPHAKAMETLGGEKAAEFAKARGISGSPQKADECLKCHVTGHGVDSRLIKYELDPADGVQCESCHGPGSDYRKKSVMSDQKKSVAKGMVLQSEAVCVTCHNDESPSWDPNMKFDYDTAKELIAHPTPADVKGRIAEIEKESGDTQD